MNNKGFTLVELLATIVIIGLVMGIATTGVLSAIDTSKKKSEKVFVDKIEKEIKSFLSSAGNDLDTTGTIIDNYEKCKVTKADGSCDDTFTNSEVSVKKLTSVNLSKITEKSTEYPNFVPSISKSDLVNPKNKEKCLENFNDPSMKLFVDDDYVYYYYVDLSGTNTSCDIADENSIITNIPKKLCKAINEEESLELKCESDT